MTTRRPLPPPPPGRTGWPWDQPPPPLPVAPAGGWPPIALVTPAYNQGQFLEAALRSILLQDYPALQCVVMDGGSADESVAILQKYAPWLDHWQSAPDGGQCRAINAGFARTTAPIMGWLNSDDLLAPGALATVGAALAGAQRTLLVGAAVTTDGPDTLDGRLDRRRPSWAEMLYEARTLPQPATFWTRDLWEMAGPLDESLYFLMDYDLWLKMRPLATLRYVDDILAYARTHPDQKSAEPDRDERFQQMRVRVALRAAVRNGQRPSAWLYHIWRRRIVRAVRRRRPALLKGGPFHHLATRAVIGRHRLSQP